jgi:NTP pyrophosphatase (non-canonical NTP hydrolase)
MTFDEAKKEIMKKILDERDRQDVKWGEQNHHDLYWLGILMEEVGELAKTIIEQGKEKEIEKEMVQVAAVAVAWLECLDKRKAVPASEREEGA